MEYTKEEQAVLDLMGRTNFKNPSKQECINLVYQLAQLPDDSYSKVLEHFPELVDLLKNMLVEYKDILGKVSQSDDKSLNHVYATGDKVIDANMEGLHEINELAGKVQADLSKELDNPSLSPEDRKAIREQEMEILRIASEKESEVGARNMEIEKIDDRKDTEKREFDWNVIKTAGAVAICFASIATTVLVGGKAHAKSIHKTK